MKKADKKTLLVDKVTEVFSRLPRGRVLDLACGDGEASERLNDLGFQVTASDLDIERFKHHKRIPFQPCNLDNPLPFEGESFDHILFLETLEHLRNPFAVIREIQRVLKKKGTLVLSTPNILNLGSRLRFLFEGGFDFFREPTLDHIRLNENNLPNMHLIPWRYQELEYLLYENGIDVESVYTDHEPAKVKALSLLLGPLLRFQCSLRRKRAFRKGGVSYARIDQILFSPELMRGRHLIIQGRKNGRA